MSGFADIIKYFFDPEIMVKALPTLANGLWVTIKVSVTIMAVGFGVGLFLAIIRALDLKYIDKPINFLIDLYADVLRASPYLVLVTIVYYGAPFLGVRFSPFWATVVTFGACLSAFAEEIFRGGIEAIDKGQVEAARASGLSSFQTLWYVVLPWAVMVSVPPLTNRTIAITKAVSLASAITLPELLKQARHLQALYANPTPLVEAAIIYVLLFFPLVRFSLYLERKMGSAE